MITPNVLRPIANISMRLLQGRAEARIWPSNHLFVRPVGNDPLVRKAMGAIRSPPDDQISGQRLIRCAHAALMLPAAAHFPAQALTNTAPVGSAAAHGQSRLFWSGRSHAGATGSPSASCGDGSTRDRPTRWRSRRRTLALTVRFKKQCSHECPTAQRRLCSNRTRRQRPQQPARCGSRAGVCMAA